MFLIVDQSQSSCVKLLSAHDPSSESRDEKKWEGRGSKLKVKSFHVSLSLQSLTLVAVHASNYFDKSILPLQNYNHSNIISL